MDTIILTFKILSIVFNLSFIYNKDELFGGLIAPYDFKKFDNKLYDFFD